MVSALIMHTPMEPYLGGLSGTVAAGGGAGLGHAPALVDICAGLLLPQLADLGRQRRGAAGAGLQRAQVVFIEIRVVEHHDIHGRNAREVGDLEILDVS